MVTGWCRMVGCNRVEASVLVILNLTASATNAEAGLACFISVSEDEVIKWTKMWCNHTTPPSSSSSSGVVAIILKCREACNDLANIEADARCCCCCCCLRMRRTFPSIMVFVAATMVTAAAAAAAAPHFGDFLPGIFSGTERGARTARQSPPGTHV